MKPWVACIAALAWVATVWVSPAWGQEVAGCDAVPRGNASLGPFDYRTAKDKLSVVEGFHFTSEVEMLVRGKTGTLGADIAYVLNKFPNHHRALMSMVNLGVREKRPKADGARYSVECYLSRAESFTPDDAMVKVIYGLYHLKHKQPAEAVGKLREADALDSSNANVQYNLGLAYFELKQFDAALASAHRAYGLGFPLPGLRDRLQRAGRWQEPEPSAAAAPASVPAQAAVPDEAAPETPAPADGR